MARGRKEIKPEDVTTTIKIPTETIINFKLIDGREAKLVVPSPVELTMLIDSLDLLMLKLLRMIRSGNAP